MRDPDLVVRAQEAATALESAWCRWRNMHGLAADPAPAVSSYVGFSLDAPWGQPRIVFGICAEEAAQLATLLDRHDCVGPVHASVKAKPVGATHRSRAEDSQVQDVRGQDVRGQDVRGQDVRGQDVREQSAQQQSAQQQSAQQQDVRGQDVRGPGGLGQDGRGQDEYGQDSRDPDGRVEEQAEPAAQAGPPLTQPGFVHVPAPAPASAGQQPLAASASSRPGPTPPAPPGPRPREAAAAALTSQVAPRRSGIGTPIALAASRAVEASMASRREAASAESAAAVPAGSDGATEGGASADPARPADPGLPSGAEASSVPPAAPPAAPAGPARPAERTAPIRPGTAPGDDTQIMTGGSGSARDLEPADDRRAVGDRGLASEPGAADDRGDLTGPPDSTASEIVAFRPRPEPAAYYPDGWEPAAPEPAELAGSARLGGPAAPYAGSEPTRVGRVLRGASLSRLKRPGSPAPEQAQQDAEEDGPSPSGRPQDGRDRVSSTAASDAAAWNASELPGQAAVTDTAV